MEIVLAKKILDLDMLQLSQILKDLQLKNKEAFNEIKELIEDVV